MTVEQQSAEPSESTSQQLAGIVDTGEESFSVESAPVPIDGKTGETPTEETPGEKPEEKPGEKPEEKPSGETPTEKPGAEEDLPKGVQKRLATMTRKRRDAERETATTRAENQELLSRIEALEHPELKPGEEPKVDDYDTEEEYLEAVSEYRADQKFAKREADQKAEAEEEIREGQETEAQARQEVLIGKLQKGVEKYEDFEDVVEDLNITGDMIQILESFPNIPDVVYALGNDPEIVAKLVDMPFLQAAYTMKEISDGLAKKKSTKAPDPIKPVTTTGGTIKSLESMSQKEYNEYRDKQDQEKRGMHY
jgi:hypothetical protein